MRTNGRESKEGQREKRRRRKRKEGKGGATMEESELSLSYMPTVRKGRVGSQQKGTDC